MSKKPARFYSEMPFAQKSKLSEPTSISLIPQFPWKTAYKAFSAYQEISPQHLPAENKMKLNAAKS